MKIGIIGAGMIGATSASLLIEAGHEIAICNSRSPATLADFVASLGPNARAATLEDAARFGELVLLAIPLREYRKVPPDAVRGKVVIDAMNYYPGRDGHFPDLDGDEMASSEMVAKHLDGARIVKAFNTIYFEHLAKQGDRSKPFDERRAIPIAGDDADAKRIVTELIDELGFGAIDTGSLRDSLRQQPGTTVFNRSVTAGEAKQILGRPDR